VKAPSSHTTIEECQVDGDGLGMWLNWTSTTLMVAESLSGSSVVEFG
jgi:hypothetical protein